MEAPANGVSDGTEQICFRGWFREDSRLIYADHLVYVELKGPKFTVYDEPGAESSIELNIAGSEVLCREKNYKIVIETSQTKMRLYAVNLHEYMNWCSVLRITAAGEEFDDSTEGFSFEKPLTSVQPGTCMSRIYWYEDASSSRCLSITSHRRERTSDYFS
uniref:PH domain-containing protein n=1 Tax=Rhodosorus marinus TaxID=101924 RepID=A0A7S3A534_9RHOD|mmetsp:Transcript_44024/g.171845  ORF Transcript_44024/g.171845 Transcript_44024/m.171845 type:complete len:161 (+) Transcript_44024:407-889(+)